MAEKKNKAQMRYSELSYEKKNYFELDSDYLNTDKSCE